MKASIILVGTELLNGMTVDTNSIYMAENLNRYGIEIISKMTVRDDIEDIIDAIKITKRKSDLVILSGGLGPTIDDITKDAIAKYLGRELIVDEAEYRELKRKFDAIGIELLPNNRKEVEKPQGAISFENDAGMAPAIYIDGIAAFPGVPRELYNMFPKFLKYYLDENHIDGRINIRDILVWGVPESHLDDKLTKVFVGDKIHYEFLVKDYGIIVRLQYKDTEASIAQRVVEDIYDIIGDNIFGEGSDRLEGLALDLLKKDGYDISLAESCTGGEVAARLVDVPGISEVFKEGIVCYSNEAKVKRLGASEETLKRHGAVSEETVREMLKGLKTKVAVATTGIAGPGGGTEEKPVGTVYIGVRIEDKITIKRYNFKGSRARVRRLSTMNALFLLVKKLEHRGNI